MSNESNENHETIADIVAEMRNESHAGDASCLEWVGAKIRSYADRIEEAAKREREAGAEAAQICGDIGEMVGREATCEKSSQVGNAAAMREALEKIANMGEQIDNQLGSSEETVYAFRNERCIAHNISECARSALSAPPRNCDIMDWRTAWAKWRTECHPQKPCGYAEVVSGTEQFMDWYMSEAKGEAK